MLLKKKFWRVRVMRKLEDWVELQAETAEEAEIAASHLPYVISAFSGSAISADKPLASTHPLGVLDDSED